MALPFPLSLTGGSANQQLNSAVSNSLVQNYNPIFSVGGSGTDTNAPSGSPASNATASEIPNFVPTNGATSGTTVPASALAPQTSSAAVASPLSGTTLLLLIGAAALLMLSGGHGRR